jgi:Na+/H+ antiporter NhaD/arsenite permease-like protein
VLGKTGIFERLGVMYLHATGGSGKRFLLLLIALVAPVCAVSPYRIVPPAVAIFGATLALLVMYGIRIEPIDAVLRGMDWKTLLFLGAIFCLVQGFIKTGLLQGMSLQLYAWFGAELTMVALLLLAGVGLLSSLQANIPVVAATLVMTKGYLVAASTVPEIALASGFTDWPAASLPVFIAMMFGATLGGNATLIGASSNIVTAGICAAEGERLTFKRFLHYGLPITLAQLAVGAVYVIVLTWLQ